MRTKAFVLATLLLVGTLSTLSVLAGSNSETVVEPVVFVSSKLVCGNQSSNAVSIFIKNLGPDPVAKGRIINFKYKTSQSGPEIKSWVRLESDLPVNETTEVLLTKLSFNTPIFDCSASVLTVTPTKIRD